MAKAMSLRLLLSALALFTLSATAAAGPDREVPYWASIRVGKVNMRVGPAET